MSTFLYEKTVDGLLTAVARAADSMVDAVELRAADDWQPTLFVNPTEIIPNPDCAVGLLDELRNRASKRVVRRVLYAAMSEGEDIGTALVAYVQQVRRLGAQADDFLADPSIRRVHDIARAVGSELHRLKGLARFRRLRDETLWAPIRPEANVVAPLALYFKGRMPSETWLIHDVRRRLAVRWDRNELAWVDPEDLPLEKPELAEDEAAYQTLWQTYFRNIAVSERRNPRLQRQCMPTRYWKYLVEVPGRGQREGR